MPAFAIGLAAIVAWLCAFILLYAASRPPRIGALVERAVIATGLAIFGTLYWLIASNTDLGLGLLDTEAAKFLVRTGVVLIVGFLPLVWVFLWLTGRLGGTEDALARLEAKLDENTVISQGARDDAHEAAEVANTVNEKIAGAQTAILAQDEDRVMDRAGDTRREVTLDRVAKQVDDIHQRTES